MGTFLILVPQSPKNPGNFEAGKWEDVRCQAEVRSVGIVFRIRIEELPFHLDHFRPFAKIRPRWARPCLDELFF